MSRLLLNMNKSEIELSHFYHFLSAYEPTENGELGFEELRQEVVRAAKKANETRETQIVSFDRVDFCLHVFPSGAVSLMAAMKQWDGFTTD